MMNDTLPRILNNQPRGITYYCSERLGVGGFGEVWGGVSSLGLVIAAKLFKPTLNPIRDLANWITECSHYVQCWSHPHIITSYDHFISPDGELVIIMERAHGDLASLVGKWGPAPPLYVASVGIQVALALEYIHTLNVIHRDVTVRNVLWFDNGVVKLADFGISKQAPSANDIAQTLIAFPGTMPPELLKYGRSTPQSDIYQLGLVLLHLLLGHAPIDPGIDPSMSNAQIAQGVPRQLAEQLIPKHGQLAAIIAKMLPRTENLRYHTPAEVRADLSVELNRLQWLDFAKKQMAQVPPSGGLPPMFNC